MSLFQDFHPIIRLVNDFERASRTPGRCSPHKQARTFQPKFDVKELKDSYVLQGELPGIDQKDISIEWTDASTIAIKGHTEHRVVKQSPPATPAPAAESEAETKETKEAEYQKPSVEEEEGEHSDDFVEVESHSQDTASTTTAQASEQPAAPKPTEEATESARYWISERSVGTFQRAFSFPVRVENESVTANLKNGILSVVVPKAKIPEPRRINIE
jgi:HSP20 family protein